MSKLTKNGMHPITCVALFLFTKDGDLFTMRRLKKSRKADGYLMQSIPGGKIDWNETAEEAIIRETAEEVGVGINIDDLYFTGRISNDINNPYHTVTLYYTAYLPEGQDVVNVEPKKHDDFKFQPRGEVDNLFCGCQIHIDDAWEILTWNN